MRVGVFYKLVILILNFEFWILDSPRVIVSSAAENRDLFTAAMTEREGAHVV